MRERFTRQVILDSFSWIEVGLCFYPVLEDGLSDPLRPSPGSRLDFKGSARSCILFVPYAAVHWLQSRPTESRPMSIHMRRACSFFESFAPRPSRDLLVSECVWRGVQQVTVLRGRARLRCCRYFPGPFVDLVHLSLSLTHIPAGTGLQPIYTDAYQSTLSDAVALTYPQTAFSPRFRP